MKTTKEAKGEADETTEVHSSFFRGAEAAISNVAGDCYCGLLTKRGDLRELRAQISEALSRVESQMAEGE